MKFTHYGHSTIALHAPEGNIVIDPGPFSDLSCLDTAGAILLTHAHADHLDVDAVTKAADQGIPVWGTAEVTETLGTGTTIHSGETIEVLGQSIDVVGGLHEEIHPDLPRPENLGFFTAGLLHPGDEYIEVDGEVKVLLLAISGPWMKNADAAEYAKRVGATKTVPVHDALLSEVGKKVIDGFMSKVSVPGYGRVESGESVEF